MTAKSPQPAPKKAAATKPAARKPAAKDATAAKRAPRQAGGNPADKTPAKRAAKAPREKAPAAEPRLLSGGNPQIPKGYGDAPMQAYIAAMPGWKRDIGARLDALVERVVPQVSKAVKWNSPLYGIQGNGWFLGVHCFERYIKLAFFRGEALRPQPPEPSKNAGTRYVHLHQNDPFDEDRLAAWIEQASRLPGERM